MGYSNATIAMFVTIIAALLAQIAAHLFTLWREHIKNRKEIYQNLYAPIITDVFAYINSEVIFYGGNKKENINTEQFKGKVIKHLESNSKYASRNLIESLNEISKYKYLDDLTGFMKEHKELILLHTFINEYRKFVIALKVASKDYLNEIIEVQMGYLLWICVGQLCDPKEARSVAANRLFVDYGKIKRRNKVLKRIIKIVKKENWKEGIIYFSKLLNNDDIRDRFLKESNVLVQPTSDNSEFPTLGG